MIVMVLIAAAALAHESVFMWIVRMCVKNTATLVTVIKPVIALAMAV
jgi:hypothetical protein